MSFWSRVKSLGGSNTPIVSLASQATLTLNDNDNAWLVTGTTAISKITCPAFLRNREITLIGAAGANCTLTNNNTPTADQMYLKGSNQLIQEDTVVKLILKIDGTWTLSSIT